jgi:hypothetical protein
MWRESMGYPLHSSVSPSLPLPCITVCHQLPHELYILQWQFMWFGKGKGKVAPPRGYETGSPSMWPSHYTDYTLLAPESRWVWNVKKYSSTNIRMLSFYIQWLMAHNSDKLDCRYRTVVDGEEWNPLWWLKENRNKSVLGLEALHSQMLTGKHWGTHVVQK